MNKKKYRFLDLFIGILSLLFVSLFTISFSAFIPCFFKGFYTPWINWLDIPDSSGFTIEKIKYAYSNLLDFIWRGAAFNPGVPMSKEGTAHFVDCIPLFWMQFIFMISSFIYLVIYFILVKKNKIKLLSLGKLPIYSYGGILSISLLAFIGIFAMIDFDKLFIIFHKVFFPGKDNWQFNWYTDQVIRILPETYFMVCAIFIVSLSIIISILFILIGYLVLKKKKEQSFVSSYYRSTLLLASTDLIQKDDKKIYSRLSKKDKKKIDIYKQDKDKSLSLLARYLEKNILEGHKIYISSTGKPTIKGQIQYNLSHKDKYVLFGLSNSSIGVDIEINKNLEGNFIDNIMSPIEKKNASNLGISPIAIFSIKESLLKCLGAGIKRKLSEEEIIFKSSKSFYYQNKIYYFKLFFYEEYVLSFVSEIDNLPIDIKTLQ